MPVLIKVGNYVFFISLKYCSNFQFMAMKSDEHVFQSRWVEAGVYILIYPYMCELMIGYRLQNVQCWGEPGPLKHIQIKANKTSSTL